MRFRPQVARLPVLTAIAALGLAAAGHAQTILSGHYDDYSGGNGYNETPFGDDYVVDPSATFNNNYNDGLGAYTNGTTTVNGGQFDGNKSEGLYAYSTAVAFNAGEADNDSLGLYLSSSSKATLNGGQFDNNSLGGIEADSNSTVDLYGGTFAANSADLISARGSAIYVYGTFGHYGTLSGTPDGTGYLVGTFTGTLANETTPQTFRYKTYGGDLTLVQAATAAVPEPSPLVFVGLGLVGVLLRSRRRELAANCSRSPGLRHQERV